MQKVYIAPPYGIKNGSNFEPFVNKRDVKDGKDEDLTQEPEMIRAFGDTWEVDIDQREDVGLGPGYFLLVKVACICQSRRLY